MWNSTMSVTDGENRRTACHREVSFPPSFKKTTLTTSLSTTEHVAGRLSSAYQFQSNPRKLTRGKLLMKHMYTILIT